MYTGRILSIGALLLAGAFDAAAANAVFNGSFEDLNSQWVDITGNYDALSAGSTDIAGWTVTAATFGQLVWGKTVTSDNHSAPDGQYFLDLSGFGSTASGGVQQGLALNNGSTYDLSIDIFGALPSVTVGAANVSLTSFTSFSVGADTWNRYTGTFVADSAAPLLAISNVSFGADIHFIDNVVISESGTPEPGTTMLLASGILLLAGARCRTKIQSRP